MSLPRVLSPRIPVVFECNNYLIVNKPADVYSQPPDKHNLSNRANPRILMDELRQQYGTEITQEWRPVHRLDHGVTGAMLVATNKNSAIMFSRYLQQGGSKGFPFVRRYVAITETGRATPLLGGTGIIDAMGMVTKYKCIDDTCFVIELVTGRKHQIRKHLGIVAKQPILNDTKYGAARTSVNSSQICLHSAFVHTQIGMQKRSHIVQLDPSQISQTSPWPSRYLDDHGNLNQQILEALEAPWTD